MNWQEMSVSVRPGAEEELIELFYRIGAGGVAIEDPRVAAGYIDRREWDCHELRAGFLERKDVVVKGYLPLDEGWPGKWDEFRRLLTGLPPDSVLSTSVTEVVEKDWAHAWKAFFKPQKVGDRVVVCPTWEAYEAVPGELVVRLDPGMAFGTGTHATTTLCVRALESLVPGRRRVVDVGTGSGVLALTAALLGAGEVLAIDNDPVAIAAARANVELNNLGGRVNVTQGDLMQGVSGPVDLVVANIIADVVMRLAGQVAPILAPGGVFLASGIIAGRLEDVSRSFRGAGLGVREIRRDGDWFLVAAGPEGKYDAQVQG